MILIKLSLHHKIAGIAGAGVVITIVLCLLLATNATPDDTNSVKSEPVSVPKTSITQPTEQETQQSLPEEDKPVSKTEKDVVSVKSEPKESTQPIESYKPKESTQPIESIEKAYTLHYTDEDAVDIAKVLYSECRGVSSVTEQACVVWTILNRVDSYDSTVYSVIRSPHQFAFYESTPIWNELLDLAYDVLNRWSREKNGETDIGRVLPKEYIYFSGYGGHNYFRDKYDGLYNVWSYTLQTPYNN